MKLIKFFQLSLILNFEGIFLDPRMTSETKSFVRRKLQTFNSQVVLSQPIDTVRDQIASEDQQKNDYFNSKYSALVSNVTETEITVNRNGYEIPVTIYTPNNYVADRPIIIFFHGGWFSLNTRQTYRPSIIQLAAESGAIWLSVEYRLSPENKFSIGLDDCIIVASYVLANKIVINKNAANAPVGVAGDDTGANFAASVANTDGIRDGLSFQILISAQLEQFDFFTASKVEFQDDQYLLPYSLTDYFIHEYINNDDDLISFQFSPILALSAFSVPTYLVGAQLEYYRDDLFEFQKRLKQLNITNQVFIVSGTVAFVFANPQGLPHAFSQYKSGILNFINNYSRKI